MLQVLGSPVLSEADEGAWLMRLYSSTEEEDYDANHKKTFIELWSYVWPKDKPAYRFRVVMAFLCLAGAKALSAWVPVLYKKMVDTLTGEQETTVLMGSLIVSYGLAKFMQTFFGELRDLIFVRVSQFSRRSVALDTFEHLHQLSLRYHLDRQTGGLSRIIERGTSGIQFVLSFMLFNVLPTLLELILIASIMTWYLDFRFALVTFVTVFSYIFFTMKVTEWRLKYRRSMNRKDEQANTKAIDSLLNYETVKYFGNEDYEKECFDRSLQGYESSAVKNQRSLAALNCGQNVVVSLGTVILLYMAWTEVQKGNLSVGGFVMVNTYMLQLFMPLNFLGFVYRQMKQSFVDMDKMFSIAKIFPDVKDRPQAKILPETVQGISFQNVEFGYSTDRQIIKNISLTIRAGETVAVVGESGSGKSTLVRLMFRFYDVTSGQILINGDDLRDWTQKSLRAGIGIVPQDTVLFNDTIRYNILYGNLKASEEELMDAARQAQLLDFINSLPSGWDTKVGERGLKVSGGEKQRIAIARAILKNPPVLILDEATSSLDTRTEKEISKALDAVTKNRTTMIIAHRLSTVVSADNIIVLNKGEIVEQGAHDELIERRGEYFQMWERQKESEKLEPAL